MEHAGLNVLTRDNFARFCIQFDSDWCVVWIEQRDAPAEKIPSGVFVHSGGFNQKLGIRIAVIVREHNEFAAGFTKTSISGPRQTSYRFGHYCHRYFERRIKASQN